MRGWSQSPVKSISRTTSNQRASERMADRESRQVKRTNQAKTQNVIHFAFLRIEGISVSLHF